MTEDRSFLAVIFAVLRLKLSVKFIRILSCLSPKLSKTEQVNGVTKKSARQSMVKIFCLQCKH